MLSGSPVVNYPSALKEAFVSLLLETIQKEMIEVLLLCNTDESLEILALYHPASPETE